MTSKEYLRRIDERNYLTEREHREFLNELNKDLEVLEIFKTITKRKGAISTALYIEDNRPKTNIIIKLDTENDKEILCNELVKNWLERKE